MATTMLTLLIIGGVVLRLMTPEARLRFLRTVVAVLKRLMDEARRIPPECQPFHDALRARTPRVLATPALIALNLTVFVLMLFGAGALSAPATVVDWGGNFGPRTTNGEWWRLATAMFVHQGLFQLLINIVGLVQIGFMLERLVGSVAFTVTCIAAGVFASLVSLAGSPLGVSGGASGAIFGLYGLLLAVSIWGVLRRSTLSMPLTTLKRLVPGTVMFIAYNLATGGLAIAADAAGLLTGFVSGLVLTRGVSERQPPAHRVVAAMATTLVIAVMSAATVGVIADVRPEIRRVVAVEDRTAATYQTAVNRFRQGRITAGALIDLIDRTIVPAVEAADARLKTIQGVPPEQQPLVAGAEEYVRLRTESWRLRAEGLRQTNRRTLGKAEQVERVSLQALKKIKGADAR